MSEEEGFLTRWSRKKRDAGAEAAAAPESSPQAAPPIAEAASPAGTPCEPPPLPPLESIGPGSDISAFLAPGVPTALSQAALRRAWSADPTIRDFIGLSENSWDFTAVDGVPGFGAISPDDVGRLLKRVMGEPEKAEPGEAGAIAAAEPAAEEARAEASPPADAPPAPAEITAPAVPAPTYKVNVAAQHELGEGENAAAPPRRRHGGALPD